MGHSRRRSFLVPRSWFLVGAHTEHGTQYTAGLCSHEAPTRGGPASRQPSVVIFRNSLLMAEV